MTLGSVWPGGNMTVLSVGKAINAAIALGGVCVPDTGTSPDSYKIAPASAGNLGPFVVCVNKAAATTDPSFAAAFPGTIVAVKADGAIEVGKEVQCSSSTAGEVVVFAASDVTSSPTETTIEAALNDRLRVVGRYLGHENEITGKVPATAAADGDVILIKLGGIS